MKIAIFGGAFNPVHREHLNIALAAVESLKLDKLFFVPTNISPHKSGSLSARPFQRKKMCELVKKYSPAFEVSDCEIARGGYSYSYVTCRRFKKQFPNDELYFIMGADMFASFSEWRNPEEILKCVTLAVCARENTQILTNYIRAFSAAFPHREAVRFPYVGGAVSSTRVRALCALGEDVSAFIPKEIAEYIAKTKLYLFPEAERVKKLLTGERWAHTVRVAVAAAEHCRKANVFEYDAILAALLHDCAKYLGENSPLLQGFEPPPDVPLPVLHQYTGAYVAEHAFGVKDENILNAIRYHTSGRENMSALEKLIFLSDMLEEERAFEGVEELRRLFGGDLDECLCVALCHQLEYLKSQKKPVYPLTERACNYIKEYLQLRG